MKAAIINKKDLFSDSSKLENLNLNLKKLKSLQEIAKNFLSEEKKTDHLLLNQSGLNELKLKKLDDLAVNSSDLGNIFSQQIGLKFFLYNIWSNFLFDIEQYLDQIKKLTVDYDNFLSEARLEIYRKDNNCHKNRKRYLPKLENLKNILEEKQEGLIISIDQFKKIFISQKSLFDGEVDGLSFDDGIEDQLQKLQNIKQLIDKNFLEFNLELQLIYNNLPKNRNRSQVCISSENLDNLCQEIIDAKQDEQKMHNKELCHSAAEKIAYMQCKIQIKSVEDILIEKDMKSISF